jgi:hypothetical protein
MWKWLKQTACIRDDAEDDNVLWHAPILRPELLAERAEVYQSSIQRLDLDCKKIYSTLNIKHELLLDDVLLSKKSQPPLDEKSNNLGLPYQLWLIILSFMDNPCVKLFGNDHQRYFPPMPLVSAFGRGNHRLMKEKARDFLNLLLVNRYFFSLLKRELSGRHTQLLLCDDSKLLCRPLESCSIRVPDMFSTPTRFPHAAFYNQYQNAQHDWRRYTDFPFYYQQQSTQKNSTRRTELPAVVEEREPAMEVLKLTNA